VTGGSTSSPHPTRRLTRRARPTRWRELPRPLRTSESAKEVPRLSRSSSVHQRSSTRSVRGSLLRVALRPKGASGEGVSRHSLRSASRCGAPPSSPGPGWSASPNSLLGIPPGGAEPPPAAPPRTCTHARIAPGTGVVSPVSTSALSAAPDDGCRAQASEPTAARHPGWSRRPAGPGPRSRGARASDAPLMLPSPTAVGDHAPSTSNR
jgi:hypothetical protein